MNCWRMLLMVLICGASSSSRVMAEENHHFNSLMMRATVKISHEKSTATGFVLTAVAGQKFILVTAAHVFEQANDDVMTVAFRKRDADGTYRRETIKLTIRQDKKPIWAKHPTEDIAAIGIAPPDGADLPVISLQRLATDETLQRSKVYPGETLSLLGYPHRNESNDAGFALMRIGTIASFPMLPTAKTKTFVVSVNSFEGDSGGPVFLARPSLVPDDEANQILGLVTSQRFLDEEAKMIYGTTKIRHRLGLAIVVHASLIKETIDRLP